MKSALHRPGLDEAAAYPACGVDLGKWTAMAGIVVGAVGEADNLPEPLREREKMRSPRKAIAEAAQELAEPWS